MQKYEKHSRYPRPPRQLLRSGMGNVARTHTRISQRRLESRKGR
ncbi:MAG TPA: hypothetical protein P5065_02940 [Candidatus Ratteibacteria bacterium]|nr:hypothetical protein [Candidatus Ratteibacteria bacterium]